MEMRSDRLKRNAAIAGYEVMIIDTGSCENGARRLRVRWSQSGIPGRAHDANRSQSERNQHIAYR